MIDRTLETDPDRLAQITLDIVDRLTDDRENLYPALVDLARWHPNKTAQIIMCLAAWHDHADPVTLGERAEAVTEPHIDWRAVELVAHEHVRGVPLTPAERREVARILGRTVTGARLAELLGVVPRAAERILAQVST